MGTNTDDKKKRKKLILSGAALVVSALLLVISYAWFYTQKEMSTAAWIKTPIVLDIRAGNDQNIQYLDMGDIEVGEGKAGSKDYVFCVYGKPVDNYSLQLAYTTNIAFHYDVYRAELAKDGSGEVTFESPNNKATFNIIGDKPVISGLSMNEIKANKESPAKYQSHALSYGDENTGNIVDRNKVQENNEPLYFLAEENGVKVMKPRNISKDNKDFLDYYVIRVSWKAGEVHEDKETDIVYLTASR
mgnify:CR=1 FL=1